MSRSHGMSAMAIMLSLILLPEGVPALQLGPAGAVGSRPSGNESDSITFAVIGDYGSGDPETHFADEVAALVASWYPSFIVTAGDDYYSSAGGTGINKYDNSTGQFYCSYLTGVPPDAVNCPSGKATVNAFFPAMGNHDYSDATPAPDTYLDYFTLPGTGIPGSNTSGNERYYDFIQGPVHFFVLNSNSQEPDGATHSSTQAVWLQTQLAASTSRWKVVVLHHAPYSTANHGDSSWMQWPFDQWGVDVVFAGHDHTYERLTKDGVVYFVGGWSGPGSLYTCGTNPTLATSHLCYDDDYGAIRVQATDTAMTVEAWSLAGDGGTLVDRYTLPKNLVIFLPLVAKGP
jgi:tartrate-resistant acid phosphatase type 5